MKWRISWHIIKAESIPVGDVLGHIVGAGEFGGLAFFENGEVATVSAKYTVDYTNGTGPH